jgi:hypothetical protein
MGESLEQLDAVLSPHGPQVAACGPSVTALGGREPVVGFSTGYLPVHILPRDVAPDNYQRGRSQQGIDPVALHGRVCARYVWEMTARAIIRTSINGLPGSRGNGLQTQLRNQLKPHGFTRIGTGAYEGRFAHEEDALDGIQVALDFMRDLPPGYAVDHLWLYLDRKDQH